MIFDYLRDHFSKPVTSIMELRSRLKLYHTTLSTLVGAAEGLRITPDLILLALSLYGVGHVIHGIKAGGLVLALIVEDWVKHKVRHDVNHHVVQPLIDKAANAKIEYNVRECRKATARSIIELIQSITGGKKELNDKQIADLRVLAKELDQLSAIYEETNPVINDGIYAAQLVLYDYLCNATNDAEECKKADPLNEKPIKITRNDVIKNARELIRSEQLPKGVSDRLKDLLNEFSGVPSAKVNKPAPCRVKASDWVRYGKECPPPPIVKPTKPAAAAPQEPIQHEDEERDLDTQIRTALQTFSKTLNLLPSHMLKEGAPIKFSEDDVEEMKQLYLAQEIRLLEYKYQLLSPGTPTRLEHVPLQPGNAQREVSPQQEKLAVPRKDGSSQRIPDLAMPQIPRDNEHIGGLPAKPLPHYVLPGAQAPLPKDSPLQSERTKILGMLTNLIVYKYLKPALRIENQSVLKELEGNISQALFERYVYFEKYLISIKDKEAFAQVIATVLSEDEQLQRTYKLHGYMIDLGVETYIEQEQHSMKINNLAI